MGQGSGLAMTEKSGYQLPAKGLLRLLKNFEDCVIIEGYG